MVSWGLVNTLGLPVGIWVLRNGPAYYRSIQASLAARRTQIRSVPPKVSRSLNLLFFCVFISLIFTLNPLDPSNVFSSTKSNLQTSTEVIFTRLEALRPLTPFDLALKPKLTSKNARLVYLAYGPDALVSCKFCTASDPQSYLYFILPNLATPHLLHVAALGVATSRPFAGRECARWRSHALWVSFLAVMADAYQTLSYDLHANSLSTTSRSLDSFFWRSARNRFALFVVVDLLLAAIMYLSSTNRFFYAPPSAAQRLENVNQAIDAATFRLWATGNIRNTVVRDRELNEDMKRYWDEERQVYESREVVDAIQAALARTNMQVLTRNATDRAEDILKSLGS